MIRIEKGATPVPQVLETQGQQETAANCALYLANQAAFDDGSQTFAFKSGIYGHETVKDALKTIQHQKCAFCESKVSHVAYGDVEHFRPKAGYRQKPDEPLQRPGYYWLAYDWDNLFYACQICNQRHKKNHFPLVEPAKRAVSHLDPNAVAAEDPLFVDPGKDNPREFIRFREEIAYPVDGNVRGETTINALGLNREEVREVRRDKYVIWKALHDLATGHPDTPQREEAEARLQELAQPKSEYSSMAIDAVTTAFAF